MESLSSNKIGREALMMPVWLTGLMQRVYGHFSFRFLLRALETKQKRLPFREAFFALFCR
jgi:hypothetical protein